MIYVLIYKYIIQALKHVENGYIKYNKYLIILFTYYA